MPSTSPERLNEVHIILFYMIIFYNIIFFIILVYIILSVNRRHESWHAILEDSHGIYLFLRPLLFLEPGCLWLLVMTCNHTGGATLGPSTIVCVTQITHVQHEVFLHTRSENAVRCSVFLKTKLNFKLS